MTSVWLFKPRSHGRKKEATRARNGAPLPGRRPSFHLPHRSASSALLCPCSGGETPKLVGGLLDVS